MSNKIKIIISLFLISILFICIIIYTFVINNNNELVFENFTSELSYNGIENSNSEEITNVVNKEITIIAIHITGEVNNQGIIYLSEGSRLADAIALAGGETKNADLSQINLAYILEDGQKIYVPKKNEKISEYITIGTGNNVIEEDSNSLNNLKGEKSKVNINTATLNELDSLPGIGPSTAQKIIDYRQENGNFKKIEDLQNVKGIGTAKYEELKNEITV